MRTFAFVLLVALSLTTLSSCTTIRSFSGPCAAYAVLGTVAGFGVVYLGSGAVLGDSTSTGTRVALGAGGAALGGFAAYTVCNRVHRQQSDLQARLDQLEIELAAERAQSEQPERPPYEDILVETDVEENKAVQMTLSGESLFDPGSDALSPQAYRFLDEIVTTFRAFPESAVGVVGYTDNTGSEQTNEALSRRRAQAVADYLASQGISQDVMEVVGLGETMFVADNATPMGRALNRRVEVYVIPQA